MERVVVIEKQFRELEPEKLQQKKAKEAALVPIGKVWLAKLCEVQTRIIGSDDNT